MNELIQSLLLVLAALVGSALGISLIWLGWWAIKKAWGFVLRLIAMGPAALVIIPVAIAGTSLLVWFSVWQLPKISGYVGYELVTNLLGAAKTYNVKIGEDLPKDANPFQSLLPEGTLQSGSSPTNGGGLTGKFVIDWKGDDQCATLRDAPNSKGKELGCVPNGTVVTLMKTSPDGTRVRIMAVDGFPAGWIHIQTLGPYQGP